MCISEKFRFLIIYDDLNLDDHELEFHTSHKSYIKKKLYVLFPNIKQHLFHKDLK